MTYEERELVASVLAHRAVAAYDPSSDAEPPTMRDVLLDAITTTERLVLGELTLDELRAEVAPASEQDTLLP